MFRNLWERLLNWLFAEDHAKGEKAFLDQLPQRRTVPGRLEEVRHHIRPRVIHRYPASQENGRFQLPARGRTPLHTDKEEIGRRLLREQERDQSAEKQRKKKQAARENDSFQGVNFKAQDVPSPVYGLRKRPSSLKQRAKGNSENKGGPSGDLHFAARQNVAEEKKMPISNKQLLTQHPGHKQIEVKTRQTAQKPGGATDEHRSRFACGRKNRELTFTNGKVTETHEERKTPQELDSSAGLRKANVNESNVNERNTASPFEQKDPREAGKNDAQSAEAVLQKENGKTTEKEKEQVFIKKQSNRLGHQKTAAKPETRHVEKQMSRPTKGKESRIKKGASRGGENSSLAAANSTVPYNVMMLASDRKKVRKYEFPSPALLAPAPEGSREDRDWLADQKQKLLEALRQFRVRAKLIHAVQGPAVTRFEIQPEPGVKVNKITNLHDDLKLSLAARELRIEAPIPGKHAVGLEIPNPRPCTVVLREMIEDRSFRQSNAPLLVAIGRDISGDGVMTDLSRMPHGLIAGTTGSGKSVCLHAILLSLIYRRKPEDVKLLLIDPKMVEMVPFQDIPHLAAPVITDPKEASQALKWATEEMERRYQLFVDAGVRDIGRYNEKQKDAGKEKLPYLVIVIDELADLMMAAPREVEEAICRLAQKARAAGIHLLLATQRPSVDVITGLIKANIPTRIAFAVSSAADSRTILDTGGAEQLLGKGDMLFLENGGKKPRRIQGIFVSDKEVERVTEKVRQQGKPAYLFDRETLSEKKKDPQEEDPLFAEAFRVVCEHGSASASLLQRRLRVGYNRASRLIEQLEAAGVVSQASGSKPREVLIRKNEFSSDAVKKGSSYHF